MGNHARFWLGIGMVVVLAVIVIGLASSGAGIFILLLLLPVGGYFGFMRRLKRRQRVEDWWREKHQLEKEDLIARKQERESGGLQGRQRPLTIGEQLAELDEMKSSGRISAAEYDTARARVVGA